MVCDRVDVLIITTDQMHCFPLAAVYGLSEGKVGRDWILDVLKRHAEGSVASS
jgi:hypothetical protein